MVLKSLLLFVAMATIGVVLWVALNQSYISLPVWQ
jgi:hypothetical protein